MKIALLFVVLLIELAGVAQSPGAPAISGEIDLLLLNGKVWTGQPDGSTAGKIREVEAVACQGGRIVAIGKTAELRRLAGRQTRVIDLAGRRVLPGFNDAHVHFADGGQGLASVQLRDAPSEAEFRDRIARFAASMTPGRWMLNGNSDH